MSAECSWEASIRRLQDDPLRSDLVREGYYDRNVLEAAYRFQQSEEWAATRALLPAGVGVAVDMGAGRGMASYALAQAGWSVVAVEPDPGTTVGRAAIKNLRDTAKVDIRICDGTAEAIPIADASVDVVYARAVLHHTADMRRACREVARILKPGGVFMAVREHVVDQPADEAVFLAGHELHALYGGEHAWPLATYRAAIEQSGLRLRKVLGSHDSVINYAPYSRADHNAVVSARLIRLMGWRLTARVTDERRRVGRGILRLLERIASASDRRPGRLVSFLGEKQ